ncbi:MAG TPA: aromatic ring-hydroxylating dioxygenase subunit alpha [Ilumatobacteraceae bacterium]|nr:aromatic ring-hydroxylating dioxygenase subunit alpha [Ilumatobacteraceae bacterium]
MNGILCDSTALANSWHPVARSVEVAVEPVAVKLLGRNVVLWRTTSGAVFATADRCPHREAPLSIGSIQDGCLTCAYHGWTFGDEGRCVRVPSATEGVPPPPRAHLDPYDCEERYGLVWVCLGVPSAPIPSIAQEDDPSFRRINTPVEVWQSSTPRMVDNFLDITHFPYVHVGTFGRGQDTVVPRFELQQLDDGYFGYRYEVMADNTIGSLVSGQTQQVVHRVMTSGFSLPFVVRSTIHYDSGLEHVLLLLSTPIDDVTSYFTFVVWRNDDFAVSAEEIIRFDLAIGAEDKRMLEQVKGVLPLDQTILVSVAADRCSVEWRRQLAEFIKA